MWKNSFLDLVDRLDEVKLILNGTNIGVSDLNDGLHIAIGNGKHESTI